MPDPQGIVSFPGINHIIGGTYTLSHGISPGICTIQMTPQLNFPAAGGTLTFFYDGTTISFVDCKIDKHSLRKSDRGEVWEVSIFDRRWKWQFGEISGQYNLRYESGQIVTGDTGDDSQIVANTEKTPRQLAQLCLEAMGETLPFPVIDDLPNDARPLIEWDSVNPAAALADLCDSLGCRVVLQLNGGVAIRKINVGSALPGGVVIEDSLSIDPPELPSRITVVCGRTKYQVDFELEAIGLDVDNTVRPLSRLSYAPDPLHVDGIGGFSKIDVDSFQGLANIQARELAVMSVFRWFRIRKPDAIPGYGPIADLYQILPLLADQVDTMVQHNAVGNPKSRTNTPAWLFGVYMLSDEDIRNRQQNIQPLQNIWDVYHRPWILERETGLVKSSDPIYRNGFDNAADFSFKPYSPWLFLRTSVHIRNAETRGWSRYRRWDDLLEFNDAGTKDAIIKHDEIILGVVPQYTNNGYLQQVRTGSVGFSEVNLAAVDAQADYYLDAAIAGFMRPLPQVRVFGGLLPQNPDGAITQVNWTVGANGATTRIVRGDDVGDKTPSYEEQRFFQRLAAQRDEAKKTEQVRRRDRQVAK